MAGKVIGANGRRLAAQNRAAAIERASEMFAIVVEFRGSGLSYRQMIQRLNARGEATPGQVGRWHVRTLQRLVARAPAAESLLAHHIIERSDGQERIEAAFATARELRETHADLVVRSAHLMARSRTLCDDLGQMRLAWRARIAARPAA